MSHLAILEELKRKSMKLDKSVRERIVEAIAKALAERTEILLGVVFGGLLVEEKPIRDIDLAVYTGYSVSPDNLPVYVDELRGIVEEAVERETGLLKAVDIIVLEYAPPRLRAKALREGRVVVYRAPGLRGLLLLWARDELRGLERSRGYTRFSEK